MPAKSAGWAIRSTVANPAAARRLGIGMVFQHFSLFEALTVAENIALAMPGVFDLGGLSAKIARVSGDYGLPLNPHATVADLSVGERQRIEIVRCLLQEPQAPDHGRADRRADAPGSRSAVPHPRTAGARGLRGACTFPIASKRSKRLCHKATILRHGKVVADADPKKETAASLARLMVGSEVAVVKAAAAPPRRRGRASSSIISSSRPAILLRSPCGTYLWTCTAARWWRSPGLPETGSPSCSTPSRASGRMIAVAPSS